MNFVGKVLICLFSAIKAKLEGSLSFDVLAERIASDTNRIKVCGLAGSLGGFVLSSIKSTTQFPLVAVTVGEEEAEELRDDLETILGQERVRYFPPCDVLPYEEKSPSWDVTGAESGGFGFACRKRGRCSSNDYGGPLGMDDSILHIRVGGAVFKG